MGLGLLLPLTIKIFGYVVAAEAIRTWIGLDAGQGPSTLKLVCARIAIDLLVGVPFAGLGAAVLPELAMRNDSAFVVLLYLIPIRFLEWWLLAKFQLKDIVYSLPRYLIATLLWSFLLDVVAMGLGHVLHLPFAPW